MRRIGLATAVVGLMVAQVIAVGGGVAAANGIPLNPSDLETLDGWVYFGADTAETGVELYRSDGSTIELVADIVPGPGGSDPVGLERWEGWIYFAATTPDYGTELWRTNGATTELYADLVPGMDSSWPSTFVAGETHLHFVASPTSEPWRSVIVRTDGTAIDVAPDHVDGLGDVFWANDLVLADGWAYYAADCAIDFRLFRTDFTTTELAPVVSSDVENGEWPRHLAALDGWVYYSADDWGTRDTGGRELWRSNGVTTELVVDLAPAPGVGSDPHDLATIGDWIYFSAYAPDHGIWRTNGGTTQSVAGVGGGDFELLGDTIYFTSDHELFGTELWATNGVDASWMVDDINPGPANADPTDLTASDGWVYFAARNAGDFTDPKTLWRSNGDITHQVGTSLLFSGFVDASRTLGPKWTRTLYTPTASGAHTFLLDWEGDANLRIAIREYETGVWVADNVTREQPKDVEANLTAGVEYKIAVWAKAGAADFTVTMAAPPGRVGEEIFAATVDADRVVARKWVRTIYTPETSGDHQFVLDWEGDGMLRTSVKIYESGILIADDVSNDRPKSFSVDLDAGVEYKIAVWAYQGIGEFTLVVYPPPG